jgi:hypothetical protein
MMGVFISLVCACSLCRFADEQCNEPRLAQPDSTAQLFFVNSKAKLASEKHDSGEGDGVVFEDIQLFGEVCPPDLVELDPRSDGSFKVRFSGFRANEQRPRARCTLYLSIVPPQETALIYSTVEVAGYSTDESEADNPTEFGQVIVRFREAGDTHPGWQHDVPATGSFRFTDTLDDPIESHCGTVLRLKITVIADAQNASPLTVEELSIVVPEQRECSSSVPTTC